MTQRLLTGVLPVGPNRHPADQVADAEKFCRHYLNRAFRGWNDMWLPQADYDDSLSRLITNLTDLAARFDEERNESFASYARQIIPKRAVDVGPRRLLGRNGNRRHERFYPLDDHSLRQSTRNLDAPEPLDPDPDRGEDGGRLRARRDRDRARSLHILGLRAA